MKSGQVEQLGTPEEVYEAPRSSFVAAFIGDTNFFSGVVAEPMEKSHVLSGLLSAAVDKDYSRLKVDGLSDLQCYNDKQIREGEDVYLSIRPEKMRISRERQKAEPHLNAARRSGRRDLSGLPNQVLGRVWGLSHFRHSSAQPFSAR